MAKITGVLGNIVQSNAYLEDTNEDLRKHYLELHALATRQRERILELEGLLGESLPWVDAFNRMILDEYGSDEEGVPELIYRINISLKEESDG